MAAPPLSLHQRIVDDISGRIISGAWPPGHRIPFESELTQIYGCSRMTVNKALSQMARAGLIERRRRSGSFVSRPRSQAAVLEIHDIRTEVEALGMTYRYELVARAKRKATQREAKQFDMPMSGLLLELQCRHSADNQSFCVEERLINLQAVPEASEETFEDIAPGPWLVSHVPWSQAEHTIRAVSADAHLAKELEIGRGAACLIIERRTWSAEQPVTFVRLSYSGENHALVARFTPSK